MNVDVVIPTAGRRSLQALLDRLESLEGPSPGRIIVIHDDRGRGPAAARNEGWRAARAEWIAFLDDDVLPEPDWLERLAADLDAPGHVGGSQGRIHVPLPPDRRATDWERSVKGLETARYATADIAYRRSVLAEVGGFDERFRRAYRGDADLALRVLQAGYRIEPGRRRVLHPVRPAGFWTSVGQQAGNADEALMRTLHGPFWRERANVPHGRRPGHLTVTAAGLAGLAALALGRHRLAAAAGTAWLIGTAELTWRRIAPGPRTAAEVGRIAATSVALPAAAATHWAAGWARVARLRMSRSKELLPAVTREMATQ